MHRRIAAIAVAFSIAGTMVAGAFATASPGVAFANSASSFDSSTVSDLQNGASAQSDDSLSSVSSAIVAAFPKEQVDSRLAGIVVDGKPINTALARAIATAPQQYCSQIDYVDQYEDLPSGCEIVALSVCLGSMGYPIASFELADNYLDTSGEDESTYLGSPYDDGGCLPPAVVRTAAEFFKANSQNARAYDISGTSMEGLTALVQLGYPVLTWTTEGMMDPYDFEYLDGGWVWYYPEHCVVLYGVDGDKALVSDSLSGLDECDAGRFAEVYEECGSMAVMVLPGTVVQAGFSPSSSNVMSKFASNARSADDDASPADEDASFTDEE